MAAQSPIVAGISFETAPATCRFESSGAATPPANFEITDSPKRPTLNAYLLVFRYAIGRHTHGASKISAVIALFAFAQAVVRTSVMLDFVQYS
jgi:hypothetical protein